MHLHNEHFDTPNYIIDTFGKYFSSVYEDRNNYEINNHKQIVRPKVLLSPIHSCSINLIEIFESLSSLSLSFNHGPVLIPSIFLKNFKFVISPPLLYLFCLSLSTEIFPDEWKTSIIRTIPKSSSNLSNISNYRPLSLL